MIGHPGWTEHRHIRERLRDGSPAWEAIVTKRDQRTLPADNRRARLRAKRALRVLRFTPNGNSIANALDHEGRRFWLAIFHQSRKG